MTGSPRYRARDAAGERKRQDDNRAAGRRYRERHVEQERERQRQVAAKRRATDPEASRARNRAWYAANRKKHLAHLRAKYAQRKLQTK